MPILTVGPGQSYATIAAAVAASQDGDVIQVQAGIYENDFSTITKQITIEGVGGMAHLKAVAQPPNGKAILVTTTSVTLRNLEFSGAKVPDQNGAGIRYEGGNLTIENCFFHDNEDGILAASDPTGNITITNSEFAHNGTLANDLGQTHNLYVNKIDTLTITGSYFHDARVGHEIKSRALHTIIQDNVITDFNGPDSDSYSIDLPDGGVATITGNYIEQGPSVENAAIIHYGGEHAPYAGSSLTIQDNIIRNDYASASAILLRNHTASLGPLVVPDIIDNQIFGLTVTQISSATANVLGTVLLTVAPPIPCFLAGTRIATPEGEVAVENLAVGDFVLTCEGEVEPIIWIGTSRAVVARGRRSAATPVIVRKGALAPNVPHRDLRLTKGHALHLDGVLIPVEYLVNHRSILWDDQAQGVKVFHIELQRHAILRADGAPAESYRDDGNRRMFHGTRPPRRSPPPCAPVMTGGPLVDDIWRRLLQRAGSRPGLPLTDGPDLHLLADGRRIDARVQPDGLHQFDLPMRPHRVRLVSRSGVPSELGVASDPRELGVALRLVTVCRGSEMRAVEASDPSLVEGFHAFEPDRQFRWTNGDALLPDTLFDRGEGACVVTIHVACTAQYPLLA